jgi:hypothetical protein
MVELMIFRVGAKMGVKTAGTSRLGVSAEISNIQDAQA